MKGSLAVFLLLLAAGFCLILWRAIESPKPNTDRIEIGADEDAEAAAATRPIDPPTGDAPVLEVPRRITKGAETFVRVNLTPRPVRSLELTINGGCTIRAVGKSEPLSQPKQIATAVVTAGSSGVRIGDEQYQARSLEIVPWTPPDLTVDDRKYRGTLRLFVRPGQRLMAVNVIALEEYLASVVDSEMPAKFPDAARRAQAIAARTYVLYQAQHIGAASQFDVYATTRSQNYLGYEYRNSAGRRLAGESADSRRLVAETAGMVCTYNGQLFCTYYSAVCGGETTAGRYVFADAAPVCRCVDCEWCQQADRYRWSARIDVATASAALERYFDRQRKPFESLVRIVRSPKTPRGSVATFRVSDGHRTHSISAADLRHLFRSTTLHSPKFTIQQTRDELIVNGQGHGHGVGLCQWGARGQALDGRGTLEILAHYYRGSQVTLMKALRE